MQTAKFKLRKSDNPVSLRNKLQREGGKGKWDGKDKHTDEKET